MNKTPFILLLLTAILTLQTGNQPTRKTPPPRPASRPETLDNNPLESAEPTPSNHASTSEGESGDLSEHRIKDRKIAPPRPASRPASLTIENHYPEKNFLPKQTNLRPYEVTTKSVLQTQPIITLKGAIKEEFRTIRNTRNDISQKARQGSGLNAISKKLSLVPDGIKAVYKGFKVRFGK